MLFRKGIVLIRRHEFSCAELLLRDLGITEPNDIDVEAIAWHVGARVKFAALEGYEARIIGREDQAIVTITMHASRRWRRFSIAHELGHWRHHRGRSLVCRSDDIWVPCGRAPEVERVADAYAADLLMPTYLFHPMAAEVARPSFDSIVDLADRFDTSLTATAIRFIDMNTVPTILVCHGPAGRQWFKATKDVPSRWFPRSDLDADSFAFGALFSDTVEKRPRKIGAEAWFDRLDAERYDITEHTVKTSKDEIMTLLLLEDEEMLQEREAHRSWAWR